MRLIALLLATTLSTQALAAEPYEGRWAIGGDCDARSETPWNRLTVGRDSFKGYEYACAFTKVTPTGIPDQWSVAANCVNEGDSYEHRFTMETTTVNDILMIDGEGEKSIVVYQRCE